MNTGAYIVTTTIYSFVQIYSIVQLHPAPTCGGQFPGPCPTHGLIPFPTRNPTHRRPTVSSPQISLPPPLPTSEHVPDRRRGWRVGRSLRGSAELLLCRSNGAVGGMSACSFFLRRALWAARRSVWRPMPSHFGLGGVESAAGREKKRNQYL